MSTLDGALFSEEISMSILAGIAGVVALANIILWSKLDNIKDLDKKFKEVEHDYEIKKIKLEQKIAKGDKRAVKQLQSLTEQFNKDKNEYLAARKKIYKKSKPKNIGIPRCNECGEKISEGAKFCPECGAKATNSVRTCSSCGKEAAEDAKFCAFCGTELK